MMWSKKDSENLASIAASLAKLADREKERELLNLEQEFEARSTNSTLISRMMKVVKDKEKPIKVTEGPSLQEEALEEDIKTVQRIQNKVYEAERNGNSPFFTEALLDEEELETL